MSAKHTPGPWARRPLNGRMVIDAHQRDEAPWHNMASVVVTIDGEPFPEGEANARLIAAAPDLLAELSAIVRGATAILGEDSCGRPYRHIQDELIQRAMRAIAKATAA